MYNARILAGGAAAAAAALLMISPAAAAQMRTPTLVSIASLVPPPAVPSSSDRQLANQLPVVDHAVDMLQKAHEDYHGHRNKAIDALNAAREDLRAALKADNIDEKSIQPIPWTPFEGEGGMTSGTQAASNETLRDVRAHLGMVIDRLQHDSHDYAGFRVQAIEDVQGARDQLSDALGIRRDDMSDINPPSSDRQLANQLPVVDHAVDMLQKAHEDYHGHRNKAIDALNAAREDLRAALRADNIDEKSIQPVPWTPIEGEGGMTSGTQASSNDVLRDVRAHLEQVIDRLQHDKHDYGGFRLKAIEDVQNARTQLDQALASTL